MSKQANVYMSNSASLNNSNHFNPSLFFCIFCVLFFHSELAKSEIVKTQYQYAAKVVCSLRTPHQDGDLARGIYRTSINIHNPSEKKIKIVEKVAVSGNPDTTPSDFSVTPFHKTLLGPDGAVQFTCSNIAGFFCPINGVCVDFAFLDGFLVIKSPIQLDVVGVYTARSTNGEVESIDVEKVHPRKIASKTKVADHSDGDIKKHIDYTPSYSNDPKQPCGGIAGIQCPDNKMCVDDPSDTCNPNNGGADCSGVCVDKP